MTTREKWIIGIGLLLLIVVGLAAFGNPKVKNIISPDVTPPLPSGCDPSRPGYNVYGYKSDICGQAYEADCDPDRPGFDMNGLPNINCGFGGRKSR